MKTLNGPVCFGYMRLRMSFSAANALGRSAEYVGGSVILWAQGTFLVVIRPENVDKLNTENGSADFVDLCVKRLKEKDI